MNHCLRLIICSMLLLFSPSLLWASDSFSVYTVNYPLAYFCERIGGKHVEVVFPAPPDIDPAFWSPDKQTIADYQQADLIVLNGADYAKWTKKVSLPLLRLVDTSRLFKEELIHEKGTVSHSHGPGGEHSHGGTAFTTWLDFHQAAMQAEAIYTALSRKIPAQKEEFLINFEQLQKDLMVLDEKMLELGKRQPGPPLLASHPIYQYFARRYNLNIKMMMWEPDTDPGKKKWANLEELLKTHQASWMIWEGEPISSSKAMLQQLNIDGVIFSPCFSKPTEGDFLSVMQENVKNMELIFVK